MRLVTKPQTRWRKFGRKWTAFVATGHARPGVLVEVGGRAYLIGDINENRGVCDDCTAFRGDAIVERYMVIAIVPSLR